MSVAGSTRSSGHPVRGCASELAKATHPPVDGEEYLPQGWSLERIKDMGFASPTLVAQRVTVLEHGVDDVFELSPQVILDVAGFCLVLDEEGREWHVGQWTDATTIVRGRASVARPTTRRR